MIRNVKAAWAAKHGVHPADRKQEELFSKRGIPSNRQGIRYGSREAGCANEHFDHKNSLKRLQKRHEQRIVKG